MFYNTKLSPQISRFCVLMVMWCKSCVNSGISGTVTVIYAVVAVYVPQSRYMCRSSGICAVVAVYVR